MLTNFLFENCYFSVCVELNINSFYFMIFQLFLCYINIRHFFFIKRDE